MQENDYIAMMPKKLRILTFEKTEVNAFNFFFCLQTTGIKPPNVFDNV